MILLVVLYYIFSLQFIRVHSLSYTCVMDPYYSKFHLGPKPTTWIDPGIGKLSLKFCGGSLYSLELR